MRKVDWRLIPILSAMYCVSLIDRTNLSLARQANNMHMDKELGTNLGNRYSIITLIFFVPYIIFEVPSQLGIRKFGARWWLGGATTLWGIIMLAMGFAPNWQTLAALRAILGLFESALFPGAAFLISCWYARREMAIRNALFYVVAGIVNTFGSPIGYGMSLLHTRGGLSGWSWIFIFFGILTIVVGLLGILFIVDFPDKATFLSDEQRQLVHTRIQRDRGDATPDPVTLAKVIRYLCDFRIWVYGLMFMSSTMSSYSLAYFLPVILGSMGFNNVETMLLNVPCTVYAFIPSLGTAYLADRYRNARGWCVVFNALCVILGTCMYSQLPMPQKAARYVGVFFAVGGCNANIPLLLAWAQTSIRAQSKRAVFAAMIVAWGGVGGILAGVVFIQKEAKRGYPTGVFFTIGMNAFTVVAAMGLAAFYRYKNKKAERGEVVLEGSEDFRYQP
ncbi:MFS general substrate transporter [Cutaneotrichosporon oleaginosum]|uniref:MFS general substrate transporter n=1 Tax=Cutaneotrichosporon oleaginosum TaxID=879819 RepID=A0A0J0XQ45_9TREE|nr:MFS general substrate transporter [Cutaneotrichosporon oleaginosum]KLT43192.1 MFS general substrate transporter [Cutaneotrichosporon oleaginosum]TXT09874.1 hypothetical protein COLE_03808 [Cutaneotrichosporon oleaginosum]